MSVEERTIPPKGKSDALRPWVPSSIRALSHFIVSWQRQIRPCERRRWQPGQRRSTDRGEGSHITGVKRLEEVA